ncbi:MAG: ATPase, partial [Caulobacteraceae bacterium]|nr:ATPase [Caulobacter sp.]
GEGGEVVLATAFRHGARARIAAAPGWRAAPLEVRVEDNGPGVDPALAQRMFSPFVTTKPSGSGLGLTVVAKIVAAHEGVVDHQSKPGRTVFRVLLPAAES